MEALTFYKFISGCRISEDCKSGEFCSRVNHVCLPDACPPLNQIHAGSVTYLNGIAFLKCLNQVLVQYPGYFLKSVFSKVNKNPYFRNNSFTEKTRRQSYTLNFVLIRENLERNSVQYFYKGLNVV